MDNLNSPNCQSPYFKTDDFQSIFLSEDSSPSSFTPEESLQDSDNRSRNLMTKNLLADTKSLRQKSLRLPLDRKTVGLFTPDGFLSSPISQSPVSISTPVQRLFTTDPKQPMQCGNTKAFHTPDSGFCTPSLDISFADSCLSFNTPYLTQRDSCATQNVEVLSRLNTPLTSRFCSDGQAGQTNSGQGSETEETPEAQKKSDEEKSDQDTSLTLQAGDWVAPKVGDGSPSSSDGSPLNKSLQTLKWVRSFVPGEGQLTQKTEDDEDKCKTSSSTSETQPTGPPTTLTPLPVIMAPPMPTFCVAKAGETQTFMAFLPSQGRKVLEELRFNKDNNSSKGEPSKSQQSTKTVYERPGFSYTDLIKFAMQDSSTGELTLQEIVTWIEEHYPYFKHEAKKSWKSSIRHNLSLHRDFVKVDAKKHGGRWKVVDNPQVNGPHLPKPVPPPKPPPVQFVQKPKRSGPQPILPKSMPYALVPIPLAPYQQLPQPSSLAYFSGGGPIQKTPQQILPKPQTSSFSSSTISSTGVFHLKTSSVRSNSVSETPSRQSESQDGGLQGPSVAQHTTPEGRPESAKKRNPRKMQKKRLSEILVSLKEVQQTPLTQEKTSQSESSNILEKTGKVVSIHPGNVGKLKQRVPQNMRKRLGKPAPVMNLTSLLCNSSESNVAAETLGRMLEEEDKEQEYSWEDGCHVLGTRIFQINERCIEQDRLDFQPCTQKDKQSVDHQAQTKSFHIKESDPGSQDQELFCGAEENSGHSNGEQEEQLVRAGSGSQLIQEAWHRASLDLSDMNHTDAPETKQTQNLEDSAVKTHASLQLKPLSVPTLENPTSANKIHILKNLKIKDTSFRLLDKRTLSGPFPRSLSEDSRRALHFRSMTPTPGEASCASELVFAKASTPIIEESCQESISQPRPKFYRTKSRRKQVHIPMKSDNSPEKGSETAEQGTTNTFDHSIPTSVSKNNLSENQEIQASSSDFTSLRTRSSEQSVAKRHKVSNNESIGMASTTSSGFVIPDIAIDPVYEPIPHQQAISWNSDMQTTHSQPVSSTFSQTYAQHHHVSRSVGQTISHSAMSMKSQVQDTLTSDLISRPLIFQTRSVSHTVDSLIGSRTYSDTSPPPSFFHSSPVSGSGLCVDQSSPVTLPSPIPGMLRPSPHKDMCRTSSTFMHSSPLQPSSCRFQTTNRFSTCSNTHTGPMSISSPCFYPSAPQTAPRQPSPEPQPIYSEGSQGFSVEIYDLAADSQDGFELFPTEMVHFHVSPDSGSPALPGTSKIPRQSCAQLEDSHRPYATSQGSPVSHGLSYEDHTSHFISHEDHASHLMSHTPTSQHNWIPFELSSHNPHTAPGPDPSTEDVVTVSQSSPNSSQFIGIFAAQSNSSSPSTLSSVQLPQEFLSLPMHGNSLLDCSLFDNIEALMQSSFEAKSP